MARAAQLQLLVTQDTVRADVLRQVCSTGWRGVDLSQLDASASVVGRMLAEKWLRVRDPESGRVRLVATDLGRMAWDALGASVGGRRA